MFERSCLWQRRLFTFVHHYASREVSCGMLTKVCRARINYLKLSCFLHYPLTVWSHIFTRCSQGGKVTFRNTLCIFKGSVLFSTSLVYSTFLIYLFVWWQRRYLHDKALKIYGWWMRNRPRKTLSTFIHVLHTSATAMRISCIIVLWPLFLFKDVDRTQQLVDTKLLWNDFTGSPLVIYFFFGGGAGCFAWSFFLSNKGAGKLIFYTAV